jgi:hypothetical protein
VCGPDAGRKEMVCRQRSQELQELPKEGKRGEGTVPGSNLAVNVRLTLTVPNFADAGYKAADITRLRIRYNPFMFDMGACCTSTSHHPAVLKKSKERIGKRCVK